MGGAGNAQGCASCCKSSNLQDFSSAVTLMGMGHLPSSPESRFDPKSIAQRFLYYEPETFSSCHEDVAIERQRIKF
jgi:hypothetical protein